ncbi:pyridoxamine 5'-phosphate oxidase family protein [Candidatus Riflebacteria bacterium]
MNKPISEVKANILKIIREPHLSVLSTVTPEGLPWVRYVRAIATDDMTIGIGSFVGTKKIAHIKNKNEVHMVSGAYELARGQNYIHIQGKAEIITDRDEIDAFWCTQLKDILFGDPNGPDYCVITVKPYRVEHYKLGSFQPEIWTPEGEALKAQGI